MLRTRFDLVDDQPVQIVEPVEARGIEEVHVAVPPGAGPDEVARLAAAVAGERVNAPFDLAAGPPLRPAVLRLGPDDQLFCLAIHHIVTDGWSARLLWSELLACYRAELAGEEPELRPVTGTFGDYAVAEHERLNGPPAAAELDYWRDRLAGITRLELPTDRPRPRRPAHRATFGNVRIDAELLTVVEQLARKERCTPFMVLLAAYQILLGQWAGQRHFAVGVPVAGRTEVEHESQLGYFSKTAVVRADLSPVADGDTEADPDFRTVLRRVRSAAMGAFAHQDVPVERLVPALGLPRQAHVPPLYQTLFVLQSQNDLSTEAAEDAVPGVALEPADAGFAQAKFDVLLDLWRSGDGGLDGSFSFDDELFDRTTVEATAARYPQLLREAVADPLRTVSGDLLLTAAERDRLLALNAGPALPAELPTALALFAGTAARNPEAVALECGDRTLSYGELDRRSSLLAEQVGARPGAVLAVRLDPSFDLVTALLAIWKAGAGYLPLDPAHPAERQRLLLGDGQVELLLTAPGDEDAAELGVPVLHVPESWPADGPAGALPPVPGSAPAYLLHTSGSTGRPKGVLVDHAALAARVHWMAGPDGYGLLPSDRIVQFASLGFDTHAEELWPALSAGARCVLLPGGGRMLPDHLRTPAAADITVLDLPTAYWSELVDLGEDLVWPAALRLVILGGSEATARSVACWRARHGDAVRLVNTYGPTEATVIVTSAELTAADTAARPPLGRPLPGVRAYVLDEGLRLRPDRFEGQLALGGAGLAVGYHGRPDLTGASFVADPYGAPGDRMYLSGDRVRWRADGQLEFLGRADDQVKIHGRRIEPGEIESALAAHPAVARAAVVARDGTRLVGYAVPRSGAVAEPAALREHLAARLPAFMVPAAFVVLDALPLTANGKLDRAALPDPGPDASGSREYLAPRTDAEVLVAGIWQDVLGVEKAGALDHFFDLGGDSLLVTRVAARIRAAVGLDVQVRDVFEEPTLAGLAARVEELLIAEIDGLSEPEAARRLG